LFARRPDREQAKRRIASTDKGLHGAAQQMEMLQRRKHAGRGQGRQLARALSGDGEGLDA
jgi:hypothetical protein